MRSASASTSGALDAGLVLEWDDTKLNNVKNLTVGSSQIQELTVKAPVKSTSVDGFADVSFALTGEISTIEVQISYVDVIASTADLSTSEATEPQETYTINNADPDYVCSFKLSEFKCDKKFTLVYSLNGNPDSSVKANATLDVSYKYRAASTTTDGEQGAGQQTGANQGGEGAAEGN